MLVYYILYNCKKDGYVFEFDTLSYFYRVFNAVKHIFVLLFIVLLAYIIEYEIDVIREFIFNYKF